VRDLASAHLLALDATGEADPSLEVYNLGSAAGFSVREVVEAARRVTGRAIPARVVKRRTGDPPVLVASSRRARRELGWQPAHSTLEQMVSDAWAWRESHPNGYGDAASEGSGRLPTEKMAATAG
jgi:UDP-glucose 4-epimerase